MISVIFNADTRPVCPQFEGMWKGVRSRDFIGDQALYMRKNFFRGHDIELIGYVDEHEPLTSEEYRVLHDHCDVTVVQKHTKKYRGADPFNAFNDVNYLHALSLARGEYVCHMDQDMALYTDDPSIVGSMLQELENHKFICYPSPHSPNPCVAPNYDGKFWASTRFFLCKRETLILDDLERGIRDNQWFFAKYGTPPVVNPWTESFIAQMADYKVYYPPVELDRWVAFPWHSYQDGTIMKLNSLPYSGVAAAVRRAGGDGVFWDGATSSLMQL